MVPLETVANLVMSKRKPNKISITVQDGPPSKSEGCHGGVDKASVSVGADTIPTLFTKMSRKLANNRWVS